jgi:phage anti-repressor protein
MKIIERSIIPIYEGKCVDGTQEHEQLVDARELWQKLESKQEFAHWIKDRIDTCAAVEGLDYGVFDKISENPSGGRLRTDYVLRLDTAKEFAMLERNEIGHQIRRYFIEAEKRYRDLKITRARAKAERRLFTDVIRELIPESPHSKWAYKNFTDLIYKHVTGYNAKQLREQYSKPDDCNVRELLTPQQLRDVVKYESIIQGLLNLGQDYHGVKAILDNPAAYLPEKIS